MDLNAFDSFFGGECPNSAEQPVKFCRAVLHNLINTHHEILHSTGDSICSCINFFIGVVCDDQFPVTVRVDLDFLRKLKINFACKFMRRLVPGA